jgi:hypothetical protein
MPRVRGKLSSKGVALVAAYMLVLQALFGAFASGAAAGTAILDDFGNPLCITSHVPGPSGGEGRDHTGTWLVMQSGLPKSSRIAVPAAKAATIRVCPTVARPVAACSRRSRWTTGSRTRFRTR